MGAELRDRRRHHRRRLDHRVRPLLRAARRRARRRGRERAEGDRGLQPLRLPIDTPAARLADHDRDRVRRSAAGPAAGGRRRRRRGHRRARPHADGVRRRRRRRPQRPSRRRSRCWRRHADTTGARTSRSGGHISTGSTTRSTNGATPATCSSPRRPRSSRTGTCRRHAPRKQQRWVKLTGTLAAGGLGPQRVRALRPALTGRARRQPRPARRGQRRDHGRRRPQPSRPR